MIHIMKNKKTIMTNQKNNFISENSLAFFGIIVLGIMLCSSLVTIYWGADRCLGLSDEGVYFLAARYPEECQENVSAVYIYTGYLFRMAGYSPMGFRLLGVMFVCFSAAIFCFGFNKFLLGAYPEVKKIKYFRVYSLLFIEIGALLLYQWFYLTPNYNTLIGIGINCSTGFILLGLSQIDNWQKNLRLIVINFAIGGVGIGFSIFTKFPAGICFLSIYFLLILIWREINLSKKVIISLSFFAGIAIWMSGHFLIIQSPQNWWLMFKEAWALFQTLGSHSPQSKCTVYFKDLYDFVYAGIKMYWPCYLIICTVYPFFIWKRRRLKLSDKANFLLIIIVMVTAIFLSLKFGVFIAERNTGIGMVPYYAAFHLAWILLLLTLWFFNSLYKFKRCDRCSYQGIKWNIKFVLGLLIMLPIAGSAGTSNPLYNIPLCHAATWFGALLLLLLFSTVKERKSYWLQWFGLLSIAAFSTSQIIQGYIYDPQQIPTNVLQQVVSTPVGNPVKTLKLDVNTHRDIQILSSVARDNGFRGGDDIIAMNYIPGLVFAMGGESPGHPTFLSGNKKHEDYTRLALRFADIKRLRNAFILLNCKPESATTILKERGLDFPDGYENLITFRKHNTNKDYSLWKPLSLSNKGNILQGHKKNDYSSLLKNANGTNNSAYGEDALEHTTGFFNSAFGSISLYSNTTGKSNTAGGCASLYSNTKGIGNTALGYSAMYSSTIGNYNTGLGYCAGYSVVVPLQKNYKCTFIGANAHSSMNGVVNSMALGYGAQVTDRNQIAIGNSSITKTRLQGNIYVKERKTISVGGFFHPTSSTDAEAPINSIYFSTTTSSLVYKDNDGIIHSLYMEKNNSKKQKKD